MSLNQKHKEKIKKGWTAMLFSILRCSYSILKQTIFNNVYSSGFWNLNSSLPINCIVTPLSFL